MTEAYFGISVISDEESYELFSDQVETMTVETVSGNMLHTSRLKITLVLAEGATLIKTPINNSEEDDDSEEEDD